MTAPISANPVGEHPLPALEYRGVHPDHPKGENKPFFPAEDETLFTKVCLKNSNPMRDFQSSGNDSVCKKIKGEQFRGRVDRCSGRILMCGDPFRIPLKSSQTTRFYKDV